MSEGTGSECSDGDWCFVTDQVNADQVNPRDDLIETEVKAEVGVGNSADTENGNKAETIKNDSCPGSLNVEPAEIESSEIKSVNLLADVDQTDSSSDVDILDANVGPDYQTPSIQENERQLRHAALRLQLKNLFSKQEESDDDEEITDIILPRSKCNTARYSRNTPSETKRAVPCRRPASTWWKLKKGILVEWSLFRYLIALIYCEIMPPQHKIDHFFNTFALFIFGIKCIVYYVLITTTLDCVSDRLSTYYAGQSLKTVQNSIIDCFGEQHIAALRSNNDTLLISRTCIYDLENYKTAIKKNLDSSAFDLLKSGIEDPDDASFLSFRNNHQDIDLSLIIKELQVLKFLPIRNDTEESLLPVEEVREIVEENVEEIQSDTMEGMRSLITNLTLANRALREQVALLNPYRHDFKTDDLIVLKDSSSPPTLDEDEDNLESNTLIDELMMKITWLHLENEKLEKDFEDMRQLYHASQNYCTSIHKTIPTDNSSASQNSSDEATEKIKPYLDNLVSTLSGQILNLHSSLANELKEVRRWNELIQNMTMEIRNSSTPQMEGSSNWSWQEIKENVENIVLEAHQDIKDKISAFQNINYTDAFQSVVQGNKENVETFLNVVNDGLSAVKDKTQEILESALPNPDATVSGFWSLMNSLHDKLQYVNGRFRNMGKKHHPENKAPENPKENVLPESSTGYWYFKKHDKSSNNYNDKRAKSDWLFKRAAQRAQHHRWIAKEKKRFA